LDETEGTQEEIWQQNVGKLAKLTANWLVNKLLAIVSKETTDISIKDKITAENFAEFISLVYENKINSTIAQKLLETMWQTSKDPSVIMDEEDLGKGVAGDELGAIIDKIIQANPDQVANYKNGKTNLLQFFVGQVMRETKGQGDPQIIQDILNNKLSQ